MGAPAPCLPHAYVQGRLRLSQACGNSRTRPCCHPKATGQNCQTEQHRDAAPLLCVEVPE